MEKCKRKTKLKLTNTTDEYGARIKERILAIEVRIELNQKL